ncbi:hypothetical protein AMTR_s00003p00265540 [Amborella trichopoda]|uniref:DUF659 domain-containing protein n=1 Tax=Amborella trichopoda TaxID=13333 RepID=W1P6A2_AMBTC|nr:hypothetical protein AMTR_s00003p00265540 [Amborella trichopoda]
MEEEKRCKEKRDAEEVGRGYESLIDEDEDEKAEFEAQMERARIASLQELNYSQMGIQEMYGEKGWCIHYSSTSTIYFYLQMVSSIVEVGPGVRGPTMKELAGPCLEAAVHSVDKHIVQFKVCWPGTGVIIMTDDWKGKSHTHLVNFLIGYPRGIVYHSSIDISR